MPSIKGRLVFSTVMTCALGAAAPAFSQEAEFGDDAIVVTAQKRAQDVQDVAISIEVIDGALLQDMQITSFEELRDYVPNLQVQPSPGNSGIYIRGFGSGPQNNGFDQSVSLYVDGVYGGRVRQFMAPMFDLERVEVLRGPQGALFGKNTAAGAISVVGAAPTRDFESELRGSYNFSREGGDVSGFISGPLSERLSARLALSYTDLDGFITNNATGTNDPEQENVSARFSLRYDPTENIDITARISFDDFTTLGKTGLQLSAANPVLDDEKNGASPFGQRERDDQTSYNASVTSNFGLADGHVLTSVTGYSTYEARVFAGGASGNPENWLATYRDDFNQWSQEFRLLSPVGQTFEYIVGAYADSSEFEHLNVSRYNLFGGTVNGQTHIDFAQESTSWSVFGQGTWNISDDLRLIGSLRYSTTEKEGRFQQTLDFGNQLPGQIFATYLQYLDEESTDPSITVQYDIAPDVMLYATYGEGSKSGGFVANTRNITASQFAFGPEESTNYEIGMRSLWFDGRVLLNLTAYQTEFADLQVAQWDASASAFLIRNAATATSQGVEAQASWDVTDNFTLATSFAYLDAAYDSFPNGTCLSTGAIPPPSTCTQDLSGTTLPGASRWSGNVSAEYVMPIGSDLEFTAFGVANFRTRYFTATDSSPAYGVQDDWVKIDARFEVAPVDDRWSVALVGRNLTDELTQSFSYLWTLSVPAVAVQFLDETRSVALEGRVRF